MKYLIHAFIGIFIIGLLSSGCKKDIVEKNIQFRIADTTYPLSWGMMYCYGVGGTHDGYGYNVYLSSLGIMWDIRSDQWSGTGNYLNFEIASSSSSGIYSGTYSFHLHQGLPVFSFDDNSSWTTGWNSGVEQSARINSGTLVVKNYGDDQYEMSFNGKDENGNIVNTYFKGEIFFYDGALYKSTGKQ